MIEIKDIQKRIKDIKIYNDMDLLKRYAKEVVLYKKDNQFLQKLIRNSII